MKSATISTGIDIIEIQRIKQAISRWNNAFLERIYTKSELEICRGFYPSLAARFAAKEAVMKALGSGTLGINWRDIEILSNENNAPFVELHGSARQKAEELGLIEFSISISHCEKYAIALSISNA